MVSYGSVRLSSVKNAMLKEKLDQASTRKISDVTHSRLLLNGMAKGGTSGSDVLLKVLPSTPQNFELQLKPEYLPSRPKAVKLHK
jgi:hypothetical protein